MITGVVFNIQRFALHDGPGIRTTVFLKGCPLTCWCCHNPESQVAAAEIVFHAGRCLRCGACVQACPTGALAAASGAARAGDVAAGPAGAGGEAAVPPARPAPALCLRCGACAEACPAAARELVGREMRAGEVLAEVWRDEPFYRESGGGATFSGGEPLLQLDFLEALLRGCRERGVHAALDTCGYAPWEAFERVRGLVDLFLYDLKSLDGDRHREFTGVGNEPILANLRELVRRGHAVVLRVPVVPGLNDDDGSLEALVALAAGLPGLRGVDLLPYHRLGAEKYARLGRHDRLADVAPPAPARLMAMAAVLRGRGLTVTTGG